MATDPDQPIADDPLAGLRKLAGLARELGVNDVSAFTEALDAARNEGRGDEVFKPLKALVEQFAGQTDKPKSLSDLGARLRDLVAGGGRDNNLGDLQRRTETALLRRIEELTATASIDGLLDLATAYSKIRSAGAHPPDESGSAPASGAGLGPPSRAGSGAGSGSGE